MEMDIISLPYEMLCQILVRLPIKTLLQIRCVCKIWHSLIISSDFILLHVNRTHDFGKNTVLMRRMPTKNLKEIYTLHDDNQDFNALETLNFPFRSEAGCYIILGCVNGLVCLWDYKSGIIMLWNPSIRKCYTLPGIVDDIRWDMGRVFGFGYDALGNDYKVVMRFRRVHYGMSDVGDGPDCLATVFSLQERSWRNVEFVPDWVSGSRPRTVKGVIYRITSVDDGRIMVVSFDLSSELCSEIGFPEKINTKKPPYTTELSIFRDSLALINPVDEKKCDIWVLREGGVVKSWSKMFALDLHLTIWEQSIVGFSKNGLVVMVGQAGLSVKPIMDSPILVNLQPTEPEFHWHVESYTESLVLLQQGDNVPLSAQNDSKGEEVGAKEPATMIIIE